MRGRRKEEKAVEEALGRAEWPWYVVFSYTFVHSRMRFGVDTSISFRVAHARDMKYGQRSQSFTDAGQQKQPSSNCGQIHATVQLHYERRLKSVFNDRN